MTHFSNLIALSAALTTPALVYWLLSRLGFADGSSLNRWACIGVTLLLVMTASAHFTSTQEMALMLPGWVPMREAVIFATGIWEVALALLIAAPKLARITGLVVTLTLVAFLPANIYAAWNSVEFNGNEIGPKYLLIRVPFQFFLIYWTLWATGWLTSQRRNRS